MYVYILIIYYYLELSIKYIDYLQTFNLFLQIFDEADCTKEDYFTSRAHLQDLSVSVHQGLILFAVWSTGQISGH